MEITTDQLTGRTDSHLTQVDDKLWLNRDVVEPFRALCSAAKAEGIGLAIASGFRSFERQLAIWNAKAGGQRPVLDADSRPLAIDTLTDTELVFAILRWSALPGTSRHHWGTDMDLWDSAAVDSGYRLQLTPAEYTRGGPFERLAEWLASGQPAALGFVRPYDRDRGGTAPEPWHLSFLPVASHYQRRLTTECLRTALEDADLLLKGAVLANLDEICERFVQRTGNAESGRI